MVKFKKYFVLLQIFAIYTLASHQTSFISSLKSSNSVDEMRIKAEPLKQMFERDGEISLFFGNSPFFFLHNLNELLDYLIEKCQKKTISISSDKSSAISADCATNAPYAYYAYFVALSRPLEVSKKTEISIKIDQMAEIPSLSPQSILDNYFTERKRSCTIKDLKLGLQLAILDEFKPIIKGGYLLKILKLLTGSMNRESEFSFIMTEENIPKLRELVGKFLKDYEIETQLTKIVEHFDLSFEETQIVERANDNLDTIFNEQTSVHETKEKRVIFAFFARLLIDRCNTILKIQSTINMDMINSKLLMIVFNYQAWHEAPPKIQVENVTTLFYCELVQGISTEYRLQPYMNLFTNSKVLLSFHRRSKIPPQGKDYVLKINHMSRLIFLKAHLKMDSMSIILTSGALKNYRFELLNLRYQLTAQQMQAIGGEISPEDRLPFPSNIESSAINSANREYFRRLDEDMTDLISTAFSSKYDLYKSKLYKSELYMCLLKMHRVMDEIENVTEMEFHILMKWHKKVLSYAASDVAFVNYTLLELLLKKINSKYIILHINYERRSASLKWGTDMSWKNLVDVYDTKDNFVQIIDIFTLTNEHQPSLRETIKNKLTECQANIAEKEDLLRQILKVVIMSQPLLNDDDLRKIALFIMKYAPAVSHIPEDVHDLIRIFFNQIYALKIEKWDKFWRLNPKSIKTVHVNLLDKLCGNLNIQKTPPNEENKPTNAILLEFVLMTFYNYQYAIRNISMDTTNNAQGVSTITDDTYEEERKTQNRIVASLIAIFQRNQALFYPKNDHFVQMLYRFFYKEIELGRSSDYIFTILSGKIFWTVSSLIRWPLESVDDSFIYHLYAFLLISYNKRSITSGEEPSAEKSQLTRNNCVLTEDDIKHLLKMRKKLGFYTDPTSKLFEIETIFFAKNSDMIAIVVLAKDAIDYTIQRLTTQGDSASLQFDFAIEMMQRVIDAAVSFDFNLVGTTYLRIIFLINFGHSTTANCVKPENVKYMKAALVAGEYFTRLNQKFESHPGVLYECMAKENMKSIVEKMPTFTKKIKECCPGIAAH